MVEGLTSIPAPDQGSACREVGISKASLDLRSTGAGVACDVRRCRHLPDAYDPGDSSGEATPVPIPNTEVKLSSAEDTERAAFRENRSSPGLLHLRTGRSRGGRSRHRHASSPAWCHRFASWSWRYPRRDDRERREPGRSRLRGRARSAQGAWWAGRRGVPGLSVSHRLCRHLAWLPTHARPSVRRDAAPRRTRDRQAARPVSDVDTRELRHVRGGAGARGRSRRGRRRRLGATSGRRRDRSCWPSSRGMDVPPRSGARRARAAARRSSLA